MKRYKLLSDLMDSVYSVDIGLSEQQGEQMYIRMLENSDWRDKLSEEINLAFADDNFSWSAFFDEHDIYSTANESDARQYAEKIILAPLRRYEGK